MEMVMAAAVRHSAVSSVVGVPEAYFQMWIYSDGMSAIFARPQPSEHLLAVAPLPGWNFSKPRPTAIEGRVEADLDKPAFGAIIQSGQAKLFQLRTLGGDFVGDGPIVLDTGEGPKAGQLALNRLDLVYGGVVRIGSFRLNWAGSSS